MEENDASPSLSRPLLTGLLGSLDRDIGATSGVRAIEAIRPELAELRSDLDGQLTRAKSAAVLCLVGSTGAGKSTLLNALVGRSVAIEGVDRPTTSAPVIYRPVDADVSELVAGIPGQPPTVVTYEPGDSESGAETFWRGQILIDAPDTNSVATLHRDVVKHLASRADVLVVVAHRQSIAELSSATFVDLFAERRGMVFVLGRRDELDGDAERELLGQLGGLARDRWRAPDAPVVSISAMEGKGLDGAGGIAELRREITSLIAEERLGSVRRRNAVGSVARIASEVTALEPGVESAAEALADGLRSGAVEWCTALVRAVHERLDVRRADLSQMLWNDAAKVWDGPGGYALKVGGLSALGLGAGAAMARRNPVVAAGLAVGSVAADRMRGAVRERQFESTSGLLPGASEIEAVQRDAFVGARLAADDLLDPEAAAGMTPSGEELDGQATRAVDEAWDRLIRVDLPREADRGVPRWLRLAVDLPVYALGAWVLFRVVSGFITESYVGLEFLMSALIIALAWLFGARALSRWRLASKGAALLEGVRGDVEQRLGQAAQSAIEARLAAVDGKLGAVRRLGEADKAWRRRLDGGE